MKFKPVSHSWVALHPSPKGVIQFIGGAFFGTFGPAFFYQHMLRFFYDQGYSLVLLPFKFTFNHYYEAGFLINEQYEILPELVKIAAVEGYDYSAYLDDRNFYWLGHSIGCKYITLLESFTALPETPEARKIFITKVLLNTSKPRSEQQIANIVLEIEALIQNLQRKVAEAKQSIRNIVSKEAHLDDSIARLFIKGQVSIFIAPNNSDTNSAIQPASLARYIDKLGWGVSPNSEETNNLIKESNLFNRLGLVNFESDTTAKDTVESLIFTLKKPTKEHYLLRKGGHLRPLGAGLFDHVRNPFDSLYGWLRFMLRIDSKKPRSLAPFHQAEQERNFEFEQPLVELYKGLWKLDDHS